MKRANWTIKKGDWIAAALVCVLALCSALALPGLTAGDSGFAEIRQDGALIRRVPLSVDQTFRIRGDYTNTVTVSDGKIAVTHSDCPTNDCVHMGWLEHGGAIVCLPNGVEIHIAGESGVDLVIQ